MRSKILLIGFIILFSFNLGQICWGVSLWKRSNSLYVDVKAYKVGDLVTVVIQEKLEAFQKSSTARAKNGEIKGEASGFLARYLPGLGAKGSTKSGGVGSTGRAGEIYACLTARVVNILPNGNLVLNGKKIVKINNEKQVLTFSGIVNPMDISSNNTVYSSYVSDVEIKYDGKLEFTEKERPNIIISLLTRLINFLF
jgi:flagellar L-ring protein precursor FlgH